MLPIFVPASKLWTKELDILFAHTFQSIHGDNVCHSKDSNEATEFRWAEVLACLEKVSWPEPLASVDTLKKRWNNMFRVWYAKKHSEGEVLRQRTIHLPALLELISERDYQEEGKPGPRKGSTLKRKKGDDASISLREDLELESSVIEVSSPPASPLLSPIQPLGNEAKLRKEVIRPAGLLEAWLSILRNPLVQDNFRIHTHAGIIIEPIILLNGIINGSHLCDPFAPLLSFAQSIALPEWVSRIVAIKDEESIREHVTQKRSFFILPSSVIKLEGKVLLCSLVAFSALQLPVFYFFLHGDQEMEDITFVDIDSNRENLVATLGLSYTLFQTFSFKSMTFSGKFSDDILLSALHIFSICLSHLSSSDASSIDLLCEQLSSPWPETKALRLALLTKILMNPLISLQPIVTKKEPLKLPYNSFIDVLKATGISVPSWFLGFASDKRENLMEALRDITNTIVFIIDLRNSSTEITWNRKPSDKTMLFIAERDGNFGGILQISDIAENRASLTILANRDAIRSLFINREALASERGEITLRSGLTLEVKVDEISLLMTLH